MGSVCSFIRNNMLRQALDAAEGKQQQQQGSFSNEETGLRKALTEEESKTIRTTATRQSLPSSSSQIHSHLNYGSTSHSSQHDNEDDEEEVDDDDDEEDSYGSLDGVGGEYLIHDDDDDVYEDDNGSFRIRRPRKKNGVLSIIKSGFLFVANVENLWDSPDITTYHDNLSSEINDDDDDDDDNNNNNVVRHLDYRHNENRNDHHQHHTRSRRSYFVVFFWFFILAISYATERSTFKLLVDRTGPYRLFSAEMVTATHAFMLSLGILFNGVYRRDFKMDPLGVPFIDIGVMALLDTIQLLLVFLTGIYVPPTLTVILVQLTLPLTALLAQFVHADGRCSCRVNEGDDGSSTSGSSVAIEDIERQQRQHQQHQQLAANNEPHGRSNERLDNKNSKNKNNNNNGSSKNNNNYTSNNNAGHNSVGRTKERYPSQQGNIHNNNYNNNNNGRNSMDLGTRNQYHHGNQQQQEQQMMIIAEGTPLPGWGGLSAEHIWGSMIIALGVVSALIPAIYSICDPIFYLYADPIPLQTAYNTLLYVSSCIPAAASQMYKEHIFLQHKQPMNVNILNLLLSLLQLILVSILAPLVYPLQGIGAREDDWIALYPSKDIEINFLQGIQCFLNILDEDIAQNSYNETAECRFSFGLCLLYSFSIISVGVAVDKIINAGATKLMYRGVSAGIIVAMFCMFAYDFNYPRFNYGSAVDGLNLGCLIILIVGAEVYHRVSLQGATFETVYPELENLYADDD